MPAALQLSHAQHVCEGFPSLLAVGPQATIALVRAEDPGRVHVYQADDVLHVQVSSPVQAVSLGARTLAVLAGGRVLAWSLLECQRAAALDYDLAPVHLASVSSASAVLCAVISPAECLDDFLLIADGSSLFAVSVSSASVAVRFTGHSAAVTAAICLPGRFPHIASCGEDRCVLEHCLPAVADSCEPRARAGDEGDVVDDDHDGDDDGDGVAVANVIARSSVLCAAPLTALASIPSHPWLLVGSAEGDVRVLDASHAYHVLTCVRVSPHPVYWIAVTPDPAAHSDILAPGRFALVATSAATRGDSLHAISVATWQVACRVSLDPGLTGDVDDDGDKRCEDDDDVGPGPVIALAHDASTVLWYHPRAGDEVFRAHPVIVSSAAMSSLQITQSSPGTLLVQPSASTRRTSVPDASLTFKSKVRSSGYATPPKAMRLFSTPLSHRPGALPGASSSKKPVLRQSKGKKSPGGAAVLERRAYPVTGPRITTLQGKHEQAQTIHQAAVTALAYSNDGTCLVTGSADRTMVVQRLPLAAHRSHSLALSGHQGLVRSVAWSASKRLVISSADTGESCLWRSDARAPLLTWQGQHAGFAYLDQFVVSAGAAGAAQCSINIHRVRLDASVLPGNDLDRLRRRAHSLSAARRISLDTSRVTALSTINAYHCNVLLAAGADRRVHAIDPNAGAVLRVWDTPHSRAPHTLALFPHVDRHTEHPAEMGNVFITTAPDNKALMWDLRTQAPVRAFIGHHSQRTVATGAAMSPCLRYLAVASDDTSLGVVTYDLASGRVLRPPLVLDARCHAATTVAYHPVHPQLCAASVSGRVHFFAPQT